MLYLGIDIEKNTHVASLTDENAKPLFRAFSFPNTTAGEKSLVEKLSQFNVSDIEIVVEATGHYWLSVYSFLIADLIRYGDFVETSLSDKDTMSLRNLSRFRNYLVSSISDLKRKVICVLDQVFPEYQLDFSNIFGETSKELLANFQTAEDFENISAEQLEEVLKNVSLKGFAQSKVYKISELAVTSFGLKFYRDSFSLQLKLLIKQIKFIEAQVADVEAEEKIILGKISSPITTIPGIGDVTAATITGEIGAVSRFLNASKLAAYAGIDATVRQSGEYQSTNNKMSKRGSPYLRKALFQAALVAAFHDPVFSDFYQKNGLKASIILLRSVL